YPLPPIPYPLSPSPSPPIKEQQSEYSWRQHDQGGARGGGIQGFPPHQEALGSHRRHGVQEHHRRAASRGEDRVAGVRQLQAAQARAAQGPESQDRGQGGRAAEEGALLD